MGKWYNWEGWGAGCMSAEMIHCHIALLTGLLLLSGADQMHAVV